MVPDFGFGNDAVGIMLDEFGSPPAISDDDARMGLAAIRIDIRAGRVQNDAEYIWHADLEDEAPRLRRRRQARRPRHFQNQEDLAADVSQRLGASLARILQDYQLPPAQRGALVRGIRADIRSRIMQQRRG